jgi:hypothetical protein
MVRSDAAIWAALLSVAFGYCGLSVVDVAGALACSLC